MALRLDWSNWLAAAALALVAVPVGLLAGIDPRFAITAALAAGFVLIAFADLATGLAGLALISFLELVPGGAEFGLVKLAGLLLALSWFALMTTRPRAELEFLTVHPYVSAALGLFVGWAALSAIWSEVPGAAMASAGRYALDAVLVLIVFTAVRSRRDLRWVLLAFVAGGAIAALNGLLNPPEGAELFGRLGSETLDPNQLAAVLLSGVALSLAVLLLFRDSPMVLLGTVLAALFSTMAVWLTASRGALVALSVALLVAIVVAGRWRPQVTIFAVLLAFVTFAYFTTVADRETRERLTAVTQGQERIEEGRTTIWQVAWRAFEDNPVQGVGGANFRHTSRRYLLEPGTLGRSETISGTPSVVHNSFLEIATELGLVGLTLFSVVVAFCATCMLRAAHAFARVGDRTMQGVCLCVLVAVVANLAALVFISDQQSKQLWLLLGLGPALYAMARAAAPPEPEASSS